MRSIEIWPDGPPGTSSWSHVRVAFRNAEGEPRVRNVVAPTLTPFLPDPAVANGTAVVVAPGGGFDVLAVEHEGVDACRWLADRGITAFLLEYRLRDTGTTAEDHARFLRADEEARTAGKDLVAIMQRGLTATEILAMLPAEREHAYEDGAQAMRLVRERATGWGIDPARVGFLGFSAGAFIATAVAQHPDPAVRPDFVAPVYGGTVEGPVPSDAPPMFCVVAADDWGLLDASLSVFGAWRRSGAPVELHVYGSGGHGFGMKKLGLPVDGWQDRLLDWMHAVGAVR